MPKKKRKIFILALLILIGALPLIPVSRLTPDDPQNGMDERVKIEIADEDLSKILTTIRGGRFISPAQMVFAKVGITRRLEPILFIEWLPTNEIGFVRVSTGFICGSLCGAGLDYDLYKEDDEWVIKRRRAWVS